MTAVSSRPRQESNAMNSSALVKIEKTLSKRKPSTAPLELIKDSLHTHEGDILAVAKDLDVRYVDLANQIDCMSELRDITLSYRESLVDLAETKLKEKLNAGDLKATLFTLKTLGKNRGYVEKRETETTITEKKEVVDLTQLSDEQLGQLESLMMEAQIVDITPDDGS